MALTVKVWWYVPARQQQHYWGKRVNRKPLTLEIPLINPETIVCLVLVATNTQPLCINVGFVHEMFFIDCVFSTFLEICQISIIIRNLLLKHSTTSSLRMTWLKVGNIVCAVVVTELSILLRLLEGIDLYRSLLEPLIRLNGLTPQAAFGHSPCTYFFHKRNGKPVFWVFVKSCRFTKEKTGASVKVYQFKRLPLNRQWELSPNLTFKFRVPLSDDSKFVSNSFQHNI